MHSRTSSYGYTPNVGKYNCAKSSKPGSSNIAMSYSGPPTEEEMNRNNDRWRNNRNYQRPTPQGIQYYKRAIKNPHMAEKDIVLPREAHNDIEDRDRLYIYLQSQHEAEQNRLKNSRANSADERVITQQLNADIYDDAGFQT